VPIGLTVEFVCVTNADVTVVGIEAKSNWLNDVTGCNAEGH
jgi:hypothetical protein